MFGIYGKTLSRSALISSSLGGLTPPPTSPARVRKRLEEIAPRALQPAAELLHVPRRVQRGADGGAELVVHRAVHQQGGALPHPGKAVDAAAGFRITRRAVLNVHRHIVKNALLQKRLEHGGVGAVGVQLDGIAKTAKLFEKLRQLRLERRFPAGDADTVQRSFPPFQKGKYLRFRYFRPFALLRQHQARIMAIGTAQITAG